MASCGLIGWGAANHGCMVSFSGVGCAALDFQALHDVISHVPGVRITRVDLALDDYDGEHITYQGPLPALKPASSIQRPRAVLDED